MLEYNETTESEFKSEIQLKKHQQKSRHAKKSSKKSSIAKHIANEPSAKEKHDFFFKYDVDLQSSTSEVSKKITKPTKSKNTMDILNTELAQSESSTTLTTITKPTFRLDELIFPPLNKNIIYKIVPSLRKYINILHKIITRLKTLQNYSDWFTEDGMLTLPDPHLNPQASLDTIQEHQYPSLLYVEPFHHSKMGLSRLQTTTDNLTVIEIKFGTLTFFHHPLFSVEHFLAQELQQTYNEYLTWKSQEILQKIETDLRIIRNTRLKLINELSEETGDSQMAIFGDTSIQKYCDKISELKERRNVENVKFLVYKEKLKNVWKDIKLVRNRMKFVNTPVILDIQKTDVDLEAVNKNWDTQLQWEIDDITVFKKCDYVRKRAEYKHAKNVYKESKDSNRSKPAKPQLDYSEDDITEQAISNLKQIYPFNSKHNVDFNLIINESIVDTSVDDPNETNRRTKLLNSKLAFQLSLDESDVCETVFVNLNNSFVIDFSETISFQILPTNSVLNLKLIDHESTVLHEDTISIPSLNLDIKDAEIRNNILSNRNKVKSTICYVGNGINISQILKPYDFTLKSLKHFDQTELINLSGEFKYKIGWSIAPKESKTLCISWKDQIYVKPDITYYYDLNGTINFDKLRADFKLSINSKLGLKDFDNQLRDFEAVLANRQFGEISLKTFNFDIEIENVRTRLLKLRNEHKNSTVKSQCIPIHEKEISPELLTRFNGEDNKDRTILDRLKDGKETEPIDVQRFVSMKYLQNVNEHILQSIQEYTLKKCNQDLVLDYQICGIRSVFSGDFYKLRTSHMARDNNMTERQLNDRLNLSVTIIQAFRLPERVHGGSKTVGELNLLAHENEAFKVSSLRPFVRLNIQGQSIQTSPAVGCNPTWNQTLNFDIRKNLSSTLTIHMFDEVKENLKSQSESIEEEEGTSTVHYRLANHWMASLQIPITGILSQTKIEGTFKMNSPPTILGYSYLNTKKSSRNLALNNEAVLLLQRDEIYITLHISLMPQLRLPLPTTVLSNIETSEVEIIEKHLINFANDYSKEFPLRQLHLTYIDTNGKSKCVTKFLQPLSIPDFGNDNYDSSSLNRRGSAVSKSSESNQGSKTRGRKKASTNTDKSESSATPRSSDIWTVETNMFEMKNLKKEDSLESMIEMCLRYVSLIPIFETTNMNGVTLMGSELLKLMCGTPLDHTILLASYFLYLGLQTWVVIGEGCPRGQSCFVMTRYNRRTSQMALNSDKIEPSSLLIRHSLRGDIWIYILYDATSGQKYDLRSAFSPLTSIFCVYNDVNIWANVQPSDKCEGLRLDFTRSGDWQAVFEKGMMVSKASVQLEDMLYTKPLPTETLRQRIEDRVRNKIQNWRSQRPTIWNRYCSAILRDSLQHWETWMHDTLQSKPEPGHRLKQLTLAYNVYGFPLNFPYTNIRSIISAIKATGFSYTEHSGVEFGLAVEVFTYPNSVLSVWVYLAMIMRK